MADKGPTLAANKLAMSRALGAAFLSHQVEQLEKSVSNTSPHGTWREKGNASAKPRTQSVRQNNQWRRHGGESEVEAESRPRRSNDSYRDVKKGADVIIVDASVLVHALYQLKKWCREGRPEIIIVPLEVLNTLDLLKKGTTSLAIRARAASRLLEAQVGVNPRIRVQQDDAYVLWDQINFSDEPDNGEKTMMGSPEWVRRTICCARWEVNDQLSKAKDMENKPKVVFAVASVVPMAKGGEALLLPVPVPLAQVSKHELRVAGNLVAYWGHRAGMDVVEIAREDGRDDDGRPIIKTGVVNGHPSGGGGGYRGAVHGGKRGGSFRGRRLSQGRERDGGDNCGSGLVERPPAVKAMMEMVAQPNSRVVRVLARGEKLEPGP